HRLLQRRREEDSLTCCPHQELWSMPASAWRPRGRERWTEGRDVVAKKRLSARQLAVLTFIWGQLSRRGSPPTVGEIAAHCGLRPPRGAVRPLRAPRERGYVGRDARRRLRVLKVPLAVLRLVRAEDEGAG